jgi:uncharacterized protein (DUF486 family)
MRPVLLTMLLPLSNVFMIFAWYAHLKELSHKPSLIAALVSWGIVFFCAYSARFSSFSGLAGAESDMAPCAVA